MKQKKEVSMKRKAMMAARADFAARKFGEVHWFEVWGGRTGYMAQEDGIYRISRHDSGSKVRSMPDRRVVTAPTY